MSAPHSNTVVVVQTLGSVYNRPSSRKATRHTDRLIWRSEKKSEVTQERGAPRLDDSRGKHHFPDSLWESPTCNQRGNKGMAYLGQ